MHVALTQLHSMENCLFHTRNQCVRMCVWGVLAIHANAHSLSVRLDNTMYDGNVPSFHLEHYNLPHYNRVIPVVGQKEKVTAIKGWLHTTAEGRRRETRSYALHSWPILFLFTNPKQPHTPVTPHTNAQNTRSSLSHTPHTCHIHH